jgi:hypothetical protein
MISPTEEMPTVAKNLLYDSSALIGAKADRALASVTASVSLLADGAAGTVQVQFVVQ